MLEDYCGVESFSDIGSHLEADREVFCLGLTYLFYREHSGGRFFFNLTIKNKCDGFC
jgi:hypothetical protein